VFSGGKRNGKINVGNLFPLHPFVIEWNTTLYLSSSTTTTLGMFHQYIPFISYPLFDFET
jgi:hypothetical protein